MRNLSIFRATRAVILLKTFRVGDQFGARVSGSRDSELALGGGSAGPGPARIWRLDPIAGTVGPSPAVQACSRRIGEPA